jgi:hypothetical protein
MIAAWRKTMKAWLFPDLATSRPTLWMWAQNKSKQLCNEEIPLHESASVLAWCTKEEHVVQRLRNS